MRHLRRQPALRHNDPNGEKYFYFNEEKNEIYFRWHVDKRMTVDRKATDTDKKSHVMLWRDFEQTQLNSEQMDHAETNPSVNVSLSPSARRRGRGRPRQN